MPRWDFAEAALVTRHAVPGVADGVLHVVPRAVATMLVFVPPAAQLGLDIVPLATLVLARCIEAVAVPGRIVVKASVGLCIRTSAPVIAPITLFVVPVELVLRCPEPLRGVHIVAIH